MAHRASVITRLLTAARTARLRREPFDARSSGSSEAEERRTCWREMPTLTLERMEGLEKPLRLSK